MNNEAASASSPAQHAMQLIDVFFYSYYMDPGLLVARGAVSRNPRAARLQGWRLVLGHATTLTRDPHEQAYGIVYALTREELDRLYRWPGVADYAPRVMDVELLQGGERQPTLCYLCDAAPGSGETNQAYLQNLLAVMRANGFPESGAAQEASRQRRGEC